MDCTEVVLALARIIHIYIPTDALGAPSTVIATICKRNIIQRTNLPVDSSAMGADRIFSTHMQHYSSNQTLKSTCLVFTHAYGSIIHIHDFVAIANPDASAAIIISKRIIMHPNGITHKAR